MSEFMHHPVVQSAVAGVVAAALVDFNAFRTWKTFHDVSTYQWGTALFRWFQGAVVGALSAFGLGVVS